MLSVIEGKQRAGKTYFALTLIIDYLKSTNRPIVTNLPLHPDKLTKYCAGRSIAKREQFASRLFLFREKTLTASKHFLKNNQMDSDLIDNPN